MPKTSPLTDIATLRTHARQHIDDGSVAAGHPADRDVVPRLLNDSLATEPACVLRCRRHDRMTQGIHAQTVAQQ